MWPNTSGPHAEAGFPIASRSWASLPLSRWSRWRRTAMAA